MLRSEVVAAIRADAGLSKAVGEEALALAETFPESAHLLNETSWVIVSRPGADVGAYQRALRLAQAACGAAPDFANYINTLGVAYYRTGQYAEAVAALEKSLLDDTTSGNDACDLYFLAMCHYRLGNAAKARECLDRAKEAHQRSVARMPDSALEQFKRFRTEAEALLAKPADTQ
jgi:tetratricopeptide (TPR) repeat protein